MLSEWYHPAHARTKPLQDASVSDVSGLWRESRVWPWHSTWHSSHVQRHVFFWSSCALGFCVDDDDDVGDVCIRVSWACQQKLEGVGGGDAQHITESPGTALMHPPARQQYAIQSAVFQSFALERQMVSPLIRMMHRLVPGERLRPPDEMLTDLKQHFQAEKKNLTAGLFIFYYLGASVRCFYVKPKPNGNNQSSSVCSY